MCVQCFHRYDTLPYFNHSNENRIKKWVNIKKLLAVRQHIISTHRTEHGNLSASIHLRTEALILNRLQTCNRALLYDVAKWRDERNC